MRLIGIKTKIGDEYVVVNTSHIVSIYTDAGDVLMTLSDGRSLRTQFTDVDHATDYVQRASSHSFTGTI
jgi:hypothetical protein